MTLLRVDASIQDENSRSRRIADIVEQEWRAERPGVDVVRRDLGTDPIPATAWADAHTAKLVAPDTWSAGQQAAVALAGTAVDQLVATEALLLATPLYNFGVSQHVKTWVDLVITDPRMAAGADPVTAGKPAVLVVVRGGSYAPGTPRDGWDHATGWLRRILTDVWRMRVEVVEQEFTLVGVVPALDQFRELAADLRVAAEAQARLHGQLLGRGRPAA